MRDDSEAYLENKNIILYNCFFLPGYGSGQLLLNNYYCIYEGTNVST